jgi:hypothetical protein
LSGEVEVDEKKFGVGMFGKRPEGMEMDGKAFEILFRAFSPADWERCGLDCDWNAAAMDDLNRPGSAVENCFGPACQGSGSRATGDGRSARYLAVSGVSSGMSAVFISWLGSSLSSISKSPAAGWRANAAALSAAGVLGDVRRVTRGLMAGCRMDCASS